MGCYLYLIVAGGRVIVFAKIGIAKDPVKRMASLATGTPLPLKLAGKVWFETREAALRAERHAHRQLKPYKTNGEWFQAHHAIPYWHSAIKHQDAS